jgi:hypothetical protein
MKQAVAVLPLLLLGISAAAQHSPEEILRGALPDAEQRHSIGKMQV